MMKKIVYALLSISVMVTACSESKTVFPDWQRENWSDYPDNPCIGLWENESPRSAIGDPQILVPGDFDEHWHAFYHGFPGDVYIPYIHHCVSDDGYHWSEPEKEQLYTDPLYLFREGGRWYLYYGAVVSRMSGLRESYPDYACFIRMKWSENLKDWSEPVDILLPELDWEMEVDQTRAELRNPCMVKLDNGKYRLYYSSGTVHLDDCGYAEPKYISFAESDSLFGPFTKYGEPIIAPDPDIPHRNYGAGAIKVYGWQNGFIGLYNSIYVDEEGASRSAINVIVSKDGIQWEEAPYNPIIVPAKDGSWKDTLIYQLDLVRWGDELRLYYNARCGTGDGVEKIGCSVIHDTTTRIHKLWCD